MAIFDWVESPGTTRTMRPRVAKTRFGDGYIERAPDGLNTRTQSWTLQFRGIDVAVADEIEAFFEARFTSVAGQESFEWTPLWSTTPIRVLCSEWSRTHDSEIDTSSISATFEQVHEP